MKLQLLKKYDIPPRSKNYNYIFWKSPKLHHRAEEKFRVNYLKNEHLLEWLLSKMRKFAANLAKPQNLLPMWRSKISCWRKGDIFDDFLINIIIYNLPKIVYNLFKIFIIYYNWL